MIYGCIGEHLPHSFSREIHERIGGYSYELKEIAPEDLDAFMRAREFRAINVTIPYKQAVIPYLSRISDQARAIGAVNTIVNRDGELSGYNTDIDGITGLVACIGLDFTGSKVLVLGTGGTSRTAVHAAKALGCDRVYRVSRTAREGALTYEEAVSGHADADFIINTTPCGMFPRTDETPIDISAFSRLRGVVDAIYNPLRTRLVLEARARGIPAMGGLYMLVAQAVRAAEIFMDTRYPPQLTEEIYGKILREKENIVLIGMPGSGKTTVAGILAKRLGRPAADTDELIVRSAGMPIPDIFARFGEKYFRDLESDVIAGLSDAGGQVIATGGGAVLRERNVSLLRRNGRIFLLDRPLESLLPTPDRPLADSAEKIERLYRERMPVYRAAADGTITSGDSAEDAAHEIERRFRE